MLLVITQGDYSWFYGVSILAIATLIAYFFFDLWVNRNRTCPAPYSDTPLRRGRELNWLVIEKVLRFLYEKHSYENPIIDIYQAAWSRETGRIFTNAVTLFDTIRVDWSFLEKRYPGRWVSWGSLTEDLKVVVELRHDSLEGFQTAFSSKNPDPSHIEKEFAYRKPGPLYVDLASGTLLGWQCVPDTDLEVLIVQKPKR